MYVLYLETVVDVYFINQAFCGDKVIIGLDLTGSNLSHETGWFSIFLYFYGKTGIGVRI